MRAVRSEPPWAALRAPSFLVEERQKSSKRNKWLGLGSYFIVAYVAAISVAPHFGSRLSAMIHCIYKSVAVCIDMGGLAHAVIFNDVAGQKKTT